MGSERGSPGEEEADPGRGALWLEGGLLSFRLEHSQEWSKLQVESGKLPENTWMTSIFSMTHEAKLSAESEGAGIANRSSEAC